MAVNSYFRLVLCIYDNLKKLAVYAGASAPLKHGRSLRPWKNEGERKSCIFSWKLGGRKIKGEERLSYVSTYLHWLPLIFSKIFSLATFARLHFIFIPQSGDARGVATGGISVFIPPKKSAQVNFLWGKNDVRTAMQQFYTPTPPKKNFYAPPKKTNFWLRPWGTRNIYHRDGKVRLTFKSGVEPGKVYFPSHFWWPDVTKLITQDLN